MSNQYNSFQSQFVPADKPYTVYAFVWGGENTTVAQLIGTMVTGTMDEKGNVKYTTNAVYRCPVTECWLLSIALLKATPTRLQQMTHTSLVV